MELAEVPGLLQAAQQGVGALRFAERGLWSCGGQTPGLRAIRNSPQESSARSAERELVRVYLDFRCRG
jgi:hypothetical protein